MWDPLAAALGPMEPGGGIAEGRLLLEVGAAPVDDAFAAEIADREQPGWTADAQALLSVERTHATKHRKSILCFLGEGLEQHSRAS